MATKLNTIVIRGAREHNLKNIDVTIPRDKMVVITGLSGSGKSSLAFDTIYAEGQRRYVESLSAYARQFLQQNQKPDVDSIDGLSPAISIEQKSSSRNPRSTVGTLTEIYDYLRLLYARIGKPFCYQCGKPITGQTVQQIVDTILGLPEQSKFMVLSPVIRGRKGEYRKELQEFRQEGFSRMRIDGDLRELAEDITLDKQKKHTLELVIDRLVLKPGLKQRLTDAVELALRKSQGLVAITLVDGHGDNNEQLFSERFACMTCGISFPELEPRLFSFNSPHGACPDCDGLGFAMEIDPEKIIPDSTKTLLQGAIKPWSGGAWSSYYTQQLKSLARAYKQPLDKPWRKLPESFRQVVLYGSGDKSIKFRWQSDHKNSAFSYEREFEGVIPGMTRRFKESESNRVREEIATYMAHRLCHGCGGKRLRKEALAVRVADLSIYELCALSISDAAKLFDNMQHKSTNLEQHIAERLHREIMSRLDFLRSVGLDYLSLDRTAGALSGGEAQRIRLATQIGSALRGVIYVLDEPSIGLHQRDNARLIATLERLRDLGNTVLVVEHDEDTMRAADHIIDMGPGAGIHGGFVVTQGTCAEIMRDSKSLTGDYLSGRRGITVPSKRRTGNAHRVVIKGARGNNLRGINVDIPLGMLVCVTGVSGSGKSTLVNDTLYLGAARSKGLLVDDPKPYDKILGLEAIEEIIDIDQSPIGRTPRSNPATYTALFTLVRDLFAGLPESRARGYTPGRYSFNVKGGRCEACEGDGILRVEMHFLPDVYVTCEHCQGKRYNRETLEVLYRGKSIADVLELTVDEAAEFLAAIPIIARKLSTLRDVGLGYVKLGQSATTLSGGEAQRIKLSRELSKRSSGKTLYILDEPTTGLHFQDVERLLHVLHRLVEAGNTVVVIEHNLDVIKTADHIIDLGPEGGAGGGTVIAAGTPEELVKVDTSYTGQFLSRFLPGQELRRHQAR